MLTKEEALRLISEKDCTTTLVKEFMGVPPRNCREAWPGQHSDWCSSCIAKEALES